MQIIATQIEIEASTRNVWKVLTDFEQYPEWNPFIHSINGTLTPGNTLTVSIVPPGGKAMTIRPVILEVNEGTGFRWAGTFLGALAFRGEHSFRIEESGNGICFHHNEQFTGLLLPFVSGILANTKTGFEAMNTALKSRTEALFPSQR